MCIDSVHVVGGLLQEHLAVQVITNLDPSCCCERNEISRPTLRDLTSFEPFGPRERILSAKLFHKIEYVTGEVNTTSCLLVNSPCPIGCIISLPLPSFSKFSYSRLGSCYVAYTTGSRGLYSTVSDPVGGRVCQSTLPYPLPPPPPLTPLSQMP